MSVRGLNTASVPPAPLPDVPPPASNDAGVVLVWAWGVLDAFGLRHWEVGFDNALRRLGQCRHRQRKITLSKHFVRMNGPLSIRDTLLHEICHALCGPGHGHGPVFRAMARRVGATPERCGQADMPPGRLVAVCGGCTRTFTKHRRPRAGMRYWCRPCGRVRGVLTFRPAREE